MAAQFEAVVSSVQFLFFLINEEEGGRSQSEECSELCARSSFCGMRVTTALRRR